VSKVQNNPTVNESEILVLLDKFECMQKREDFWRGRRGNEFGRKCKN